MSLIKVAQSRDPQLKENWLKVVDFEGVKGYVYEPFTMRADSVYPFNPLSKTYETDGYFDFCRFKIYDFSDGGPYLFADQKTDTLVISEDCNDDLKNSIFSIEKNNFVDSFKVYYKLEGALREQMPGYLTEEEYEKWIAQREIINYTVRYRELKGKNGFYKFPIKWNKCTANMDYYELKALDLRDTLIDFSNKVSNVAEYMYKGKPMLNLGDTGWLKITYWVKGRPLSKYIKISVPHESCC